MIHDDELTLIDGEDVDIEPASIPTTARLAEVAEVAERQLALEREVARLEGELTAAKKALADVAERELPNLLDDIGIPGFMLRGGGSVMLETAYHASISATWPEARQRAAFDWLEQNGYGALVKHNVTVQFDQGSSESQAAREFIDLVRRSYPRQSISDGEFVHWQTLKKIVRERVEAGRETPLETLGGYVRRFAKITLPRSRNGGTG